jgi:lipopolysaccharide export system protein LptA
MIKFVWLFIIAVMAALPVMAEKPAAPAGKTPMTISADQALEWRSDAKQYVARGKVKITQDTMELTADQVVADYRTVNKTQEVYRLTATGSVVIKTATETATGSRAVYDRDQNLATLDGPVTITRGQDVLTGARATVNLTTKLSTLYGDQNSGRVKGVFYTAPLKTPVLSAPSVP